MFACRFLVALVLLVGCSVPGPVLKPADAEQRIDLPGLGMDVGIATYGFAPGNGGWSDIRIGELILHRKSPFRARAGFELRLIARNRAGSLRLKSYEGSVSREGDVLDLHVERCHIYGKRDYTDRLVPLEGWNCDHLALRFRINGARLERIRDLKDDTARTHQTDWLHLDLLRPLAAHPKRPERFVWAGQRLAASDAKKEDLPVNAPTAKYGDESYPGGMVEETDGAVYYGYDAGRHLRPGDALSLYDAEGELRGRSRVLHVVGDFVLVQQAVPGAPIAATVTTRVPKSLFD